MSLSNKIRNAGLEGYTWLIRGAEELERQVESARKPVSDTFGCDLGAATDDILASVPPGFVLESHWSGNVRLRSPNDATFYLDVPLKSLYSAAHIADTVCKQIHAIVDAWIG